MDREAWEEEQRRIDREWYNIDEGDTSYLFYIYLFIHYIQQNEPITERVKKYELMKNAKNS